MNRPMGSQQEHICLVPLTENSLSVLITEPVPWQLSKDLHYWPVLHKKKGNSPLLQSRSAPLPASINKHDKESEGAGLFGQF